jgi:ATP-binding cassette subfamily F protein 3
MIRLESISKEYPNGKLFSNVNFLLKKGMRVGLVGPNGAGKTTLLKIMLGEEVPNSGSIKREKKITIGHLAQEIVPENEKSVLRQVLESYPEIFELESKIKSLSDKISNDAKNIELVNKLGDYHNKFEALGGWNLEKKAKKILGGLGFKEKQFQLPMNDFSGGWRMRVALAALLLKDPDILFLDEPTNHLDLDATIWLESFLADWKGGLVMISHDREFLDRSINYTIEIELKKVVLYKGNFSNYVVSKKSIHEQHMNAYLNQQKQIKDTEKFIDRFRYKNTKSSQVQSRVKMLKKMEIIQAPPETNSKIKLVLPEISRSPLKVIFCENVNKSYGTLEVFSNLNFVVERGQRIGLVGKNGSGKSTLLKMLANEESVSSGTIRLGSNIKRSYYAQHQLEVLKFNDTVYQTIEKTGSGWSETVIRKYLGSFLFSGDQVEKQVKILSGGEKARLALAKMLVEPSHLLLLDEPTNHLDMVSRNVLENALKNYSGSIICISHDRHFLNQITNITCEVVTGNIKIYNGNYEYYEWKSKEKLEKPIEKRSISESKSISSYKVQKKIKNRMKWIFNRYEKIDIKIKILKQILSDPLVGKDYEKLQEIMEKISNLEQEYLVLIEEEESLKREKN